MVKALGEKLKDQPRLESGRTDLKKKREDLGAPLRFFILFTLCQDKCRLHLLGHFLVPHGINRRISSLQISHRSKVVAIRLSDLKFSFMRCVTDKEKRKQKKRLTF